jgi:hypothetical protein
MSDTNQLSRGGALAMGSLFVACGVFPILIGTGVVAPSTGDAPGWVGTAAGALFIFAGFDIILDYAIAGGVGPDGDLKPGTPTAIRVANLIFGLVIVGLLTSIFGWVAFGPGERHFTSTLTLPFMPLRWQSGELSGRIAFGGAAVLGAVMFVACGVSGVRRLHRAVTAPNAQ